MSVPYTETIVERDMHWRAHRRGRRTSRGRRAPRLQRPPTPLSHPAHRRAPEVAARLHGGRQ